MQWVRIPNWSPLLKLSIQGTAHPQAIFVENVGVDHHRSNILMPQQFLHGVDILAILERVRSKAMAESVADYSFLDAC
jgi:hypothetical protein